MSIPEQTAYGMFHHPGAMFWEQKLANMEPVSQAAIRERVAELKELNRPTSGVRVGPGGVPIADYRDGKQEPPREVHDVVQTLTHGPEGAKQLQVAKGFLPEVDRFATGLLDPESLALLIGGGTIARAGGPLIARGITAGFAGMMGKSAYDKLQAHDPGGAAADLFLGAGAIGAHALAEKVAAKAKAGEPTAKVGEPTVTASRGPDSLGQKVDPASIGDGGRAERVRQVEAQRQAEQDRAREQIRQERQREAEEQARQRAATPPPRTVPRTPPRTAARPRPSTPPPPVAPESQGVTVDPGTPHPEVDKLNANTDKVDPRILDKVEVAKLKQTVKDAAAKRSSGRKLSTDELRSVGQATNKYSTYVVGMEDFVSRFKAATGKDPKIDLGHILDGKEPVGREEVLNKIRESLSAGHTTFDKMFPGVKVEPEVASVTEKPAKPDLPRATAGKAEWDAYNKAWDKFIADEKAWKSGKFDPSAVAEPEQPSALVPRETLKPAYEMSAEEIDRAYESEKAHEKGAVERVFGARAKAYSDAQRTANSAYATSDPKVKSADRLIDSM